LRQGEAYRFPLNRQQDNNVAAKQFKSSRANHKYAHVIHNVK